MKKIIKNCYYLLLTMLMLTLFACGNGNKSDMKMTLKLSVFDEDSKPNPFFNIDNAINKTIEVFTKRLNELGCNDIKIEKSSDPLILNIELKGVSDTSSVRAIMQTTARLGFWETYELNDVFVCFDKANKALIPIVKDEPIKGTVKEDASGKNKSELDSILATEKGDVKEFAKENPLFSILSLSLSQNESGIQQPAKGPCADYALIKDTARINYLLNLDTIKLLFPRNLKFLWTAKPFDDNKTMLQLICIKTNRDQKAIIEGDVVVNASHEKGQARNEIMMEMNSEGARMWKRLTAENINRSIAIVLDNYVYTFPMVVSEIENGKSAISGNFTEQEAQTLAILIKSGALPLKVEVVSEEVIQKK